MGLLCVAQFPTMRVHFLAGIFYMQYDIYGLGSALLDIEYNVTVEFMQQHEIQKGVMTLVDDARQAQLIDALGSSNVTEKASGGSAANSLIAAQHFGAKGFFSSKVANDQMGQDYLAALKKAGLGTNYDHHEPGPGRTGSCLVMVTDDADRTMNTYLGISIELSEKEIHAPALQNSQYLYTEGYLLATPEVRPVIFKAFEIARAANVKIALSLSDPFMIDCFKEYFVELVGSGVDMIFCNEDEAKMFTGTQDVTAAAEAMKRYAKTFAITLGAEGSLLFDGQFFIEIPTHKVKAVDTVGAGDMYAGAFLAGLCQGQSFAESGALASQAATQVVTRYGPRLSRQEALDVMAACNTVTA